MTTLDRKHDVIQMAIDLGLDAQGRPTAAIIDYCMRRIDAWLKRGARVKTIETLEQLVCKRLGLVFEEFWSDEELDQIIARYVAKGEPVFLAQRDGFGPDTFATLIRRDRASKKCPDRFVALIDCRGEKAARRFFSRWHEIAHLLTLTDGQLKLFHRSTTQRDPIEQLMDKIAAEIGFYDPIFRPAVEDAVASADYISFDLVDEIRESMCPVASFQATLIAVVNRLRIPALTLEAGLGFKKSERDAIANPGLFPEARPEPSLRVLNVGGNDTARNQGLRIHRNMRVPKNSVISRLFCEEGATSGARAVESLSDWVTSDGGVVGDHLVVVEARRRGDSVIALIAATG